MVVWRWLWLCLKKGGVCMGERRKDEQVGAWGRGKENEVGAGSWREEEQGTSEAGWEKWATTVHYTATVPLSTIPLPIKHCTLAWTNIPRLLLQLSARCWGHSYYPIMHCLSFCYCSFLSSCCLCICVFLLQVFGLFAIPFLYNTLEKNTKPHRNFTNSLTNMVLNCITNA